MAETAHAMLIECVTKLGKPNHCTGRMLDEDGIDDRGLGPEIFDRARMADAVADALDRGVNRVIIDMSESVWITSEGLSQFIGVHQLISERNGRMVLANLNDRIQRIFDVSGLTKVFEITGTVSEALALVEEPD